MNGRALGRHPILLVGLCAGGLLVAAETVWLHRRMTATGEARAKLLERQRELRELMQSHPAGAEEAAAVVEAELARLQERLASGEFGLMPWRAATEDLANTALKKSSDVYFELAAFVEHMREQAMRDGVEIRADERFGFAEFAHAGPEPAVLNAVLRQREVAREVLEALFAARPKRLLACQRERAPEADDRDPASTRGASSGKSEDHFDPSEHGLQLAVAGQNVAGFRIAFLGQTGTLRVFLSRLARSDLPLVVRRVEVEPEEAAGVEQPKPSEDAGERAQPMIRSSWSRCTVTVALMPVPDLIRGIPLRAPSSGSAGANTEASAQPWPSPQPQHRGGWLYEVFTPPEIYYDALAKRFVATAPVPPKAIEAATGGPTGWGIALVQVRSEPFRLQLVGYVGGEEGYRGVFENVASGETFLAGAGRRVADLRLKIEAFAVERRAVALPESTTVPQRVAVARVRDETTGEAVALASDQRRLMAGAVATIRIGDGPLAVTREVREGEAFPIGGGVCRVEKIKAAPPSIDVVRLSEGPGRGEYRRLVLPTVELAGNAPAAP